MSVVCSGQMTTSPSSRGPAPAPSGPAPSIGKERTSVGASRPRWLAVELADPVGVDDLDREVAVGDAAGGESGRDRGAVRGRHVFEVDAHSDGSGRAAPVGLRREPRSDQAP